MTTTEVRYSPAALRPPSLRWISVLANTVAIVVPALALAGWIFEVQSLTSAGGSITMKANTSIGLLACGLSLWLISSRAKWSVRLAIGLAVLAGTIGVLTLTEHLAGWNLGIDELLFVEGPGALATASPGRMGPNGSVSLTFASLALLSLRRHPFAAQLLAFWIAIFATVPIVGYWYGAEQLYSVARYTGIAWPTALTLLLFSVGILCARPDVGHVAALVGDTPGGVMARRVLLSTIIVPLALGYLGLVGQRLGLYDVGLGAAIFAVGLMVILTALILRTARSLDIADRARQAIQHERDDLLTREQTARETAERASRLKDEFLAVVSHELRTPCNTIVGWTEILRMHDLPEDQRTHATAVLARNGRLLARLVEDLLDVSRMATGHVPLDLQPLELTTIATAAIDAISSSANDKGIRVTARFDGTGTAVAGDPHRLEQIVGNLLSNAVKFTPAGGSVEVSVRGGGSVAELTVRDSGQGISPDFMPHVFERFRQGDGTTTREYSGLGLGLAIAQNLAELHGGRIEAMSDGEGQGATFTLSLPLLDLPSVAAAAATPVNR